jgi:hypothetical protein
MTNTAKPKQHRERLTIQVEPDVRASLLQWADEEGRPVGNLVRRVLRSAVLEHRGADQVAA